MAQAKGEGGEPYEGREEAAEVEEATTRGANGVKVQKEKKEWGGVEMAGRLWLHVKRRGWGHWVLVAACCVMAFGGLAGGMLMGRLYYDRGGKKIWLYTVLQTLGWPILLPPLFWSYWRAWNKEGARGGDAANNLSHHPKWWRNLNRFRSAGGAPPNLALLAIYPAIGFLFSLDNFFFALGISYLPVSTSALLTSSQLAFNAVFSFLLVRHRFTSASLNAVFLITIAAVLLGLRAADASTERPAGVSQSKYNLGFAAAICAAAVFGFTFPLMELTFKKIIRKESFCVVLEAQVAIAIFATTFSLCGMAVNREFPALPREASSTFDSAGPLVYSLVLAATAVSWQLYFLGSTGLIFVVSSLFSNLITTATFPAVALLAIPSFGDSVNSLKIIAMILAVWGIVSYVYGGYEGSAAPPPSSSSSSSYDAAAGVAPHRDGPPPAGNVVVDV